jgi:hypothetical protein
VTLIIAVKTSDGVIIQGDKNGFSGWGEVSRRHDAKVFIKGAWGIGFTTSYRMGQILRDKLTGDIAKGGMEAAAFALVEEARAELEKNHYSKLENNQAEGGTWIATEGSHIICIQDDYAYNVVADDYCCVGCGARYASAIMEYTKKEDALTRLDAAYKITIRLNTFVGGGYNRIQIPRKRAKA